MLIGGVIGVVVVVGVVAAVFVRQRTQDDVHSVEHYHRQLHTLEEIRAQPAAHNEAANGEAPYPATAFRVSGSSNVRLREGDQSLVPPVPPPPVANPAEPAEPVKFDDEDGPEAVPSSFMSGGRDKAMDGINHRPRRIGGPAAAVAAVIVLVVVLIVTGLHASSPPPHKKGASAGTTTPTTTGHRTDRHPTTTTSTTAPPNVSAAQAVTAHGATYQVPSSTYSLGIAATTGECWVEATNTATGSVLFTTTLFSGQSHTIPATGPVTVIAGAPGAFAATVERHAGRVAAGQPGSLHAALRDTRLRGRSGVVGDDEFDRDDDLDDLMEA